MKQEHIHLHESINIDNFSIGTSFEWYYETVVIIFVIMIIYIAKKIIDRAVVNEEKTINNDVRDIYADKHRYYNSII